MKTFLIIALSAILTSCSSTYKTFTNGSYIDPQDQILLDDKFNESDAHKIIPKMITTLAQCSKVHERKTKVIVGNISNQTSEHIDTDIYVKQIKKALGKSKYFQFVGKESRDFAEAERLYQEETTLHSEKLKPHEQHAPDYILAGSIHSNVQQKKEDKIVYYYISLSLINIRTMIEECQEDVEIKKTFELE